MEKIDAAWKVYDITFVGISLVMSFRDQFGEEVNAGGIDGLIKSLHAKYEAHTGTYLADLAPLVRIS